MSFDVIGRGLLAKAFTSAGATRADAIICASGVSDSQCSDTSAFLRERMLLGHLARRARVEKAVLVYFSAAPVYGQVAGLRVESAEPTPDTPYGHHKLECETLVGDSGARYLVLRLPNVVGPGGHTRQLIPALVAQALNGSIATRIDATRDLLDVDDLVLIVAALLGRGVCNTILNVASGISTPVPRLVEMIADIIGTFPSVLPIEGGDSQAFSIAKVRRILPEYPRFQPDYPFDVLRRRVPVIAQACGGELPR